MRPIIFKLTRPAARYATGQELRVHSVVLKQHSLYSSSLFDDLVDALPVYAGRDNKQRFSTSRTARTAVEKIIAKTRSCGTRLGPRALNISNAFSGFD